MSNLKRLARKRAPALADLHRLETEAINPRTARLDQKPVAALVQALQREDAMVAPAVRRAAPAIAAAVKALVLRFRAGGRLIYVGAGTSGRLGVLDAAELPPTFGVPPSRVVGVMAGGLAALTRSVEGAEDDRAAARHDLHKLRLTPLDSVVAIAASGRTPYTVAGLQYAGKQGCLSIALTCVTRSELAQAADVAIEVVTGAEAVAGSTRLKAGTAQKMVLNQLSTALMVRMGYIRGNLMDHVQPSNAKLRARARRIRQTLSAKA